VIAMSEWQSADFTPPRGLSSAHVQTLLPRLLPRIRLAREMEILELPDGDFVELSWIGPAPKHDRAPIFLLFHGLEGSFDSPYARWLLATARDMGWRAVLMHFRGCGSRPNRLPRAYHSGDTADAYWLMGELSHRYPQALKIAAGVSLGGNMLLKLVAEQEGPGSTWRERSSSALLWTWPPVRSACTRAFHASTKGICSMRSSAR
jgi:uncharacterized protein